MSTFCSLFQQVLELFPRNLFAKLVAETKSERHARGFSSWDQFVAMLFCQLGKAQSLREICDALESIEGKVRHLGIDAPKRSTLAYANQHRPWQLFEGVFHQLLARVQGDLQPRHKFKFKNKLLSIDATMIDLCASAFDWAHYKKTKGAVKLHMVLDHAGYLPTFCVIAEGRVGDRALARDTFDAPPGTIVVFDRGYVNYAWYNSLTARGIWFVTRPKTSDVVAVLESRPIPPRSPALRDEIVVIGKGQLTEQVRLRRVTVLDDDGKEFEIVTNNEHLAASTIAAIYRDRWNIEIFFKTIKQNLKIKSFVGTSANALKIQIWSALIAILVLKYLQMKARSGWSMSRLVALLRMHLFTYRHLWTWLDDPFARLEPEAAPSSQIALQFG